MTKKEKYLIKPCTSQTQEIFADSSIIVKKIKNLIGKICKKRRKVFAALKPYTSV